MSTSAPYSDARPRIGMVLPGGGARGAYQVGVLKAIARIYAGQRTPFPIKVGVSVGAINAASLSSRADSFPAGVERLERLWANLEPSSVYRTDMRCVARSGLQWLLSLTFGGLGPGNPKSLLDTAPLARLLRRELQLDRIPEMIDTGVLEAVAVTASSYATNRAVTFFQGHDRHREWIRTRRDGLRATLTPDHLLASTSLPLLFPAHRIGNEYFGDGSLRLTAPLSPAIRLGADKLLIIGVRDAAMDRPPTQGEMPDYPSLGALAGYLMDVIFSDNLDADIERLRRINSTLALLTAEERNATPLRPVEPLVIRPSQDLREIAARHAHRMPRPIRMLMRGVGAWGPDGRLASFLLFQRHYTQELIALGYRDGMAQEATLRRFLQLPEGDSPASAPDTPDRDTPGERKATAPSDSS